MNDLNELAIQARSDELALEEIIKHMTPMCKTLARRYESSVVDKDEVMQWCRLEIWKAVETYKPERGKTFSAYCNMSTRLHIQSLIRRRYGKKQSINNNAFRLDRPWDDGEDVDWALLDRTSAIESIVCREEALNTVRQILYSEPLSPLEQRCMRLFYFEDQTYEQIVESENLKSTKTVDNALARVKRKFSANPWLREQFQELIAM